METPRMGLLLPYMFLATIETPRMGLLCNETGSHEIVGGQETMETPRKGLFV